MSNHLLVLDVFQKLFLSSIREDFTVALQYDFVWLGPIDLELPLHFQLLTLFFALLYLLL